ncbi:DHH family phosphoesterase [Candidatus Woesearchaeota archaeon]|nr:DHH family phosphoesterase [Candidatus Woesearchaeota archaeon]
MRGNFLIAVKEAIKRFNELRNDKPIRIISHLDCDGLSSAAILTKAFYRMGIKFVLSVVKILDKNILEELAKEQYEIVMFLDIGSSYLKDIEKYLGEKHIFVLDHHLFEEAKTKAIHLNPHIYDVNDYREISGAGIVYFFSKELDENNIDLAYISIIGAIGDVQEKGGFSGLNKMILDDAVSSGKLGISNGLRLFGIQTRPLHKVLEYSIEPYIPGVTGNEDGAISFLRENEIEIRDKNNNYRKMINLNEEELKKLVTGIILRRLGSEENPEDIFGNVYNVLSEEEGNVMRDAREFSTLLNCCGRLGKPGLGIASFFGNKEIREEAIELLNVYKKEIINSLDWFYKNRKTRFIIERQGYVIINAEDNIKDTLIGTLTSIISKSNVYDDGTILISMAHSIDETKISARIAGRKEIDLRTILQKTISKLGNYLVGGHKTACGGLIPQEKEFEFIKATEEILSKAVLEENVVA